MVAEHHEQVDLPARVAVHRVDLQGEEDTRQSLQQFEAEGNDITTCYVYGYFLIFFRHLASVCLFIGLILSLLPKSNSFFVARFGSSPSESPIVSHILYFCTFF